MRCNFKEAEYHVAVTPSTMDEARRLSSKHSCGLVYADEQSSGRGRLAGRVWRSAAGQSLLVTFWLPENAFEAAPPALLAGIAVIRSLEQWSAARFCNFRAALRIKWPNDILCGEKKLAGILCETSGGHLYIGIGINCLQSGFSGEYRTEPSSIFLETGHKPETDHIRTILVENIEALLCDYSSWKSEYEAHLAWKNMPVIFSEGIGHTSINGIVRGIDDRGALILEKSAEPRFESYVSGELKAAGAS